MLVKLTPLKETKLLFTQMFLNKTDKVSKITDLSVLNAIAYGSAKISQKSIKDSAVLEASLFPREASGEVLDEVAKRQGVPPRFLAVGSSTYVRLVGDTGTFYDASSVKFLDSNGVNFELSSNITIGDLGYIYALVRSVDVGDVSNVKALSINRIVNKPVGHNYVINEYQADGGSDNEQDEEFRSRIINSFNYLSAQTLQKLTQLAILVDNRVLRLVNLGKSANNQTVLGVIPVNGINFTESELTLIFNKLKSYLSISDLAYGSVADAYGTVLSNVTYKTIDVDFRVILYDPTLADKVRVELQLSFSKYLDYRYWDSGKNVEWDNLLGIVKANPNVRYAFDSNFIPSTDINIVLGDLPRIKSFVMRDEFGNILIDKSGYINPIYYPNNPANNFVKTI